VGEKSDTMIDFLGKRGVIHCGRCHKWGLRIKGLFVGNVRRITKIICYGY